MAALWGTKPDLLFPFCTLAFYRATVRFAQVTKLFRLYRWVMTICCIVRRHWPVFSPFYFEVTLRLTVSQLFSLGVRRPSGTRDQFYFRLQIFFWQLRVCNIVAPFLTRGRVCNVLYNCFWALPEQLLLGRSPAELTDIFHCLISDSPNLEGKVPVFISPRNRVAQLYLGSLFVASYNSQGLRWRYSNPPPHGSLKTKFLLNHIYHSVRTSYETHFVSATDPTRSLRTTTHTLPSHLRLCSLFVASYDSQRLRWRCSNPPPHG
jgi:hypothetical protein